MVSLLCLSLLIATLPGLHALRACTAETNGYCINKYRASCPRGMAIRYTGCGLLEQCCYTVVHPPRTGEAKVTPAPPPTCGTTDYKDGQRIVGGDQTVIAKYPWTVSVRFEGQHSCGASIINKRWLVTAAHCFYSLGSVRPEQFSVIAGSSFQDHFQSRANNFYDVQRIITHAMFQHYNRSDIALIKVNRDINLSGADKKSICLPQKGQKWEGHKCVVTGWGKESGTLPPPSQLREVSLPVVDQMTCGYYMNRVIHETMLCAGRREGGQDACQGDSGGPLACNGSDNIWRLAGIVSYGYGCAEPNRFGVYTDVSMFYDWLHQYIDQ